MEIFVTGGNGLLGTHLVDVLSKSEDIDRIYILVRDIKKARQSILENENINKNKILLLEGNLTSLRLGLNDHEISLLDSVQEVYHLAASVSLSNNIDTKSSIFEVNVTGTKNLLDILTKKERLNKFFFISSAYSCGYYEEEVPEDWLTKPKKFRNFYEESKFQAEQLVKEYSDKYRIQCIVLRPSILLSDYPSDHLKIRDHTIYLYGKLLLKIVHQLAFRPSEIRLLGDPHAPLNFVHVRDLINIIVALRKQNRTLILNITNASNTTINDILQSIKKGIDYEGEFIFLKDLDLSSLSNPELAALKYTEPFTKYTLNHKIIWQIRNATLIKDELNIKDMSNDWIKKHVETFFHKLRENEK